MKELYIYDEIGPSYLGLIDGKSFSLAMDAVGNEDVTIRINSPGGDAFQGLAILDRMGRHGAAVNVAVDAMAASAASIIAMGAANGGTTTIAENAYIMVHKPKTVTIGDDLDHDAAADLLRKVADTLLDVYGRRVDDREAMAELMAAETYFTAAEALEIGLVDTVAAHSQIAANVSAEIMGTIPPDLLGQGDTVDPLPSDRRRAAASAGILSARLRIKEQELDLRNPPNLRFVAPR